MSRAVHTRSTECRVPTNWLCGILKMISAAEHFQWPFNLFIQSTLLIKFITHSLLSLSLPLAQVKDKPTVEQFISMNRGINNGGDLPRGLLESLYDSIRTEPFKIPQDDGNDLMHTFFNPDKEGWLWKQGGR